VIKNILVPLTGLESDNIALEAAQTVAAKFSAEIECLRVHPSAMQIIARAGLRQFFTTKSTGDLILSLQDEATKRTRDAKAIADAFARRHPDAKVSWRQVEGDCVPCAAAEAKYHDLIVFARSAMPSDFPPDAVASIVVAGGRPVLFVPDHPFTRIGTTVAIAWKETTEAARAVTASMPLLAHAKRVVALTVVEAGAGAAQDTDPAEKLADKLRRHGIQAEGRCLLPAGHDPWKALLQNAREAGADLIVMGAYGHSRVRELVLGGFTRGVLEDCDLPVLLQH
jgi:nucleotide-binding universal stress UspA family protein